MHFFLTHYFVSLLRTINISNYHQFAMCQLYWFCLILNHDVFACLRFLSEHRVLILDQSSSLQEYQALLLQYQLRYQSKLFKKINKIPIY